MLSSNPAGRHPNPSPKLFALRPKATNVQWVFLGCSDVGKDKCSSCLSVLFGVPHIAFGNFVREELKYFGPLSKHSFSLEKLSGKKCYMLAARDLDIVWGDTPQYWRWINHPESRFSEVAELLDVCWFEIKGKIKASMLSPGTNYAAYLVFTSKTRLYGFDNQPVDGYVGVSGRNCEKRIVCLDPEGAQRQRYQIVPRRVGWFFHRLAHTQRYEDMFPEQGTEYAQKRDDGWMEVMLGECFVEEGEDGELEASAMEVNGGNWKSGLVIQGIEIRPKESN